MSRNQRFRALFDAHYSFIWRQLRRLGVAEDAVDDCAQELFVIAARRLDDIHAGSERSFLYGIARRIGADARRSQRSRSALVSDAPIQERIDPAPDPEQTLDARRAQELLDEVLAAMEPDTREAFVLFELEHLSKSEVASLLGIPEGTAASRLRRAREEFLAIARRIKSRLAVRERAEP
jgi:RNA polymerase sigma-70 factor (ECF subfamily)